MSSAPRTLRRDRSPTARPRRRSRSVIADHFAPAITGVGILEREVVHARLDRTVGNPVAKAAVDMAIWDAIGQTLGASVSELLGGFTDRMRVSHMVGFAPPRQMVAEAERIRDEYGITTFKVKVGRNPVTDRTSTQCRALRDGHGPDVELYIDGNRGWTAQRVRPRAARDGRPRPHLRRGALPRRRRARPPLARSQHSTIPMFADESVPDPGEVTRELLAGAATGISIKTSRTGFTTSQRLLGLCEGLGVEVVHRQPDRHPDRLAVRRRVRRRHALTARRPAELSNFLDMTDDLLAEPLVIEDGELRVRQGPGLGIEIDEDKLAHYRTDS